MTNLAARGAGGEALPVPLRQALEVFATQGLGEALQGLYQTLPATTCARRGACCTLLPPLVPLEAYAWLAGQTGAAPQDRARQLSALVEHFLINAVQRRPCPWALSQACSVYAQRFWACRAYGLWSPAVYAPRRAAALGAQERVAQAWASLGVKLPQEVLAPGPDYCGQVFAHPDGAKVPDLAGLLARGESRLEELALGLPWREEMLSTGGDLAYLLARLALGDRACLAAKVEITSLMVAGRAQAGRERLDQCLRRARAWARTWEDEL